MCIEHAWWVCDDHTPGHPCTADEAWYWLKHVLYIGIGLKTILSPYKLIVFVSLLMCMYIYQEFIQDFQFGGGNLKV